MKLLKLFMLSFVIVMMLAGALMAQDKTMNTEDGMRFVVNDSKMLDNVTFKSYAPLEDIVGFTSEISGYLVFDPFNPKKGGHGVLDVPITGLTTGIPLRDEHMQSAGWLDAEKFPNASLRINSLKDIKEVKSSNESASYDLTVVAEFTLHGITKVLEFPGRITYLKESEATQRRMPGNLLAARASFTVALKDFAVNGPEGMAIVGSKVGETIDIEVSIMGSTMAKLSEN